MEPVESNPSVSLVYLFLARCFSYPQEDFYNLIKDEHTEEQLKVILEALPFNVNFTGIPSASLSQEKFESEYINSFDIAPSCPLYESVYTGQDTSSRDIIEELFRFYDYFNVKLSDKERDYPDHLVTELEFMAYLAQREGQALESGQDAKAYRLAQRDFLERHLAKWIPTLDERVQSSTNESFYIGASSFMKTLIERHLLYLKGAPP